MLDIIQKELDDDLLQPNQGDGLNHIFKIICGAGNNSKNDKKFIKETIYENLSERGYDMHFN